MRGECILSRYGCCISFYTAKTAKRKRTSRKTEVRNILDKTVYYGMVTKARYVVFVIHQMREFNMNMYSAKVRNRKRREKVRTRSKQITLSASALKIAHNTLQRKLNQNRTKKHKIIRFPLQSQHTDMNLTKRPPAAHRYDNGCIFGRRRSK